MNTEILDKEKMASELRESFLMRKDGRFPDEVTPSFRPAVGAMIESCTSLTTRILTAIAIGLDLDRDFFTSAHKCMIKKGSMTSLRVQHYPPVPDDVSEDAIRCGAHTDYGTITLLFQDDMGGLQVRDREGNWIDAEPIPGTIVVNVGDLLQFWTAYKLIATDWMYRTKNTITLQRRYGSWKRSLFTKVFSLEHTASLDYVSLIGDEMRFLRATGLDASESSNLGDADGGNAGIPRFLRTSSTEPDGKGDGENTL
ncbi:uncharacterized protein [Panulirus ornatus]|uniref:uncharacterized protein isoform X2 n=1 Tax=Panulirus ornatus TaxID=150431 RepID=UPI003A8A8FC6